MGCWEAWQSYDDGIKVVSKSERWHFCRPQANIGQGNGWALPTHERRKVFYYWSWYFLHSFTSFHAHTNTEMPSQWSSAVVPGSLFTALRRMSQCCFSEKSQRCLTESSQTNWLTSSYNVLKKTPFLKVEKGIPVWKAQLLANIGFRNEDRFLLSCVIFSGQIILKWAVEQEKDCLAELTARAWRVLPWEFPVPWWEVVRHFNFFFGCSGGHIFAPSDRQRYLAGRFNWQHNHLSHLPRTGLALD